MSDPSKSAAADEFAKALLQWQATGDNDDRERVAALAFAQAMTMSRRMKRYVEGGSYDETDIITEGVMRFMKTAQHLEIQSDETPHKILATILKRVAYEYLSHELRGGVKTKLASSLASEDEPDFIALQPSVELSPSNQVMIGTAGYDSCFTSSDEIYLNKAIQFGAPVTELDLQLMEEYYAGNDLETIARRKGMPLSALQGHLNKAQEWLLDHLFLLEKHYQQRHQDEDAEAVKELAGRISLLTHQDILKRPETVTEPSGVVNIEWHKAQDEGNAAGLLLETLRERKGLTQVELGRCLDVSGAVISDWEHGGTQINPRVLPLLQKQLELSDEENNLLTGLRFPALDAAWLDSKTRELQAGILLKTFRERACLSQETLAHAIGGIGRTEIDNWETGTARIIVAKLPVLQAALKLSDQERQQLLLRAEPALNPKWLAQQPQHRQAGLLLAAHRHISGMQQVELAHRIGSSRQTVSEWEKGHTPVAEYKLTELKNALQLQGPQLKNFITAALQMEPARYDEMPQKQKAGSILSHLRRRKGMLQRELAETLDVDRRTVIDWEQGRDGISPKQLPRIKEALKIGQESYGLLLAARFPALDAHWLAGQPEAQQAGLLLKALRESRCIEQAPLAQAIGVAANTVQGWEDGLYAINSTKIDAIAQFLHLEPDVVNRLTLARFPAFDADWLQAQHEARRAGLLLKAFRTRAGMHQDALELAIGAGPGAVTDWENGVCPIRAPKLLAIKRALHLGDAEYNNLLLNRLPALNDEWLSAQPVHKQAGLLLAACRDYAGFERQQDLAAAVGISAAMVGYWETGAKSIAPERVEQVVNLLRKAMQPLPSEERWFMQKEAIWRECCTRSNSAVRHAQTIRKAESTHVGQILPPQAQRQAGIFHPHIRISEEATKSSRA